MIESDSRFMRALKKQPVDQIPIWLMRQAGRYLPEYRKIRQNLDFMQLCQTPELACEITLQPIRRFNFDAAIIFSDILVIPHAMGLNVSFEEGHGPRFQKTIQTVADIEQLATADLNGKLEYVMQSVRLVCHELAGKIPLIGFAGSPWTLATYMLEGGSSKDFKKVKSFMYAQPQAMHSLLGKLTTAVHGYLQAQIDAGASAVMLFDTWGGILSHHCYLNFSLQYLKKIVDEFKRNHQYAHVPIILFTKNGGLWFKEIMNTNCDAISIDWTMDLAEAFHLAKGQVAIQGNLDPAVLYTNSDVVTREVNNLLSNFSTKQGYIFNLGHGILPDVGIAEVEAMINAVRSYKF